jgi:hypothetical protein
MGLKSVTPEEKEKFKELNRIRMKLYRDKDRKLTYAHRGKYRTQEEKKENIS